MKVAFYSDCNSRGGVFVYTLKMANLLLVNGFEVLIVTHAPRSPLEMELFETLKKTASYLKVLPREGEIELVGLAKNIADYLEKNKISFFFPNYRDAPFLALHWLTTVKSIAICHNNHESYYKKIFRFDPVLNLTIFPNKSGMQYCEEKFPLHTSKYEYIPHFVETYEALEKQKNKNDFYLIYFGRIEQEQKAIFEIIKIAISIRKRGKRWKIFIFGDGSDKNNFIASTFDENLSDIIKVGDALSWNDLKPKIEGAYFSILTSTYEGFCYSAAESMSLGVPLACYENSAIHDYIKNGENGIVVSWGDIDGLIDNIECIASDNFKYSSMVSAARYTIATGFSCAVVSDLYVSSLIACKEAKKNSCWHFLRPKLEPARFNVFGRAIEYFGKKIGLWK